MNGYRKVMKISLGKFLHFKLPCLFTFFLFLLTCISGSLYWILSQNFRIEYTSLEAEKCPFCFGTSLCPKFLGKLVKPSTLTKTRFYDSLWPYKNSKVQLTLLEDSGIQTELLLEKLATDRDGNDFEIRVCSELGLSSHCDTSYPASALHFTKSIEASESFGKFLKGSSPMFFCPSTRLLSDLFQKYKETSVPGHVTTREKLQIWTTAVISQEPLMLQMFPASDGWPFRQYYGACGWYVATSQIGLTLAHFYHDEWHIRAGIAYQLMKLADLLSNNRADFALYLTEVSPDIFAVDGNGTVRLVDLNNILVVDKQAVKSAHPTGWNELHESIFTECQGQSFHTCHSFSEVQLCSHIRSDHNFYAICRYILAPNSDGQGDNRNFGLLHGMPEVAVTDWDLEYLLNECVMPTRQRGRELVVHKIIEALAALKKLEYSLQH